MRQPQAAPRSTTSLMCLGLGALYVGLGILLTERILRSARVNAALQLS